MKVCTKCKVLKYNRDFQKRSDSNALRSHCKKCDSISSMERMRKNGYKYEKTDKGKAIRKKIHEKTKKLYHCAINLCPEVQKYNIIVLQCSVCEREFGVFHYIFYRKDGRGGYKIRKYCSVPCANIAKSNKWKSRRGINGIPETA